MFALKILVHHSKIPSAYRVAFIHKSIKDKVDFSLYPKLDEDELEEQFIHGSGPGGQCVNKAHNCVLLKHKPTGVVVKCHHFRETQKNRQLAREKLLDKLDEHLNGDQSVASQVNRLEKERNRIKEEKAAALREMKKKFKEKMTPEHPIDP